MRILASYVVCTLEVDVQSDHGSAGVIHGSQWSRLCPTVQPQRPIVPSTTWNYSSVIPSDGLLSMIDHSKNILCGIEGGEGKADSASMHTTGACSRSGDFPRLEC